VVSVAIVAAAQANVSHPSFEIFRKRMDVDVDGAPTAYGPKNKKTLDNLKDAHVHGHRWERVVGYLTDDDNPKVPVVQGPNDPAPGYYISQTAYTDQTRTQEQDVRRYVDATKINYVVRGKEAKRRGVKLGDFVAVYSRKTHRSVFGIVADDGNPSGDEGSLHLLQSLGYPFHNGKDDSVEKKGEIIVRYFPGSNPNKLFFHTQQQLDQAAQKLGLNKTFASPAEHAAHPN
jgi:hypothetical protein